MDEQLLQNVSLWVFQDVVQYIHNIIQLSNHSSQTSLSHLRPLKDSGNPCKPSLFTHIQTIQADKYIPWQRWPTSLFICLLASLFLAVLTGATNVPGTVYRADTRKPDEIKAAGGFKGFPMAPRRLSPSLGTSGSSMLSHTGRGRTLGSLPRPRLRLGNVARWTSPAGSTPSTRAASPPASTTSHQLSRQPERLMAMPRKRDGQQRSRSLYHTLGTSFYRQADAEGDKRSITYTWETWAARSTKDPKTSGTKKTSRDNISLLKKAGTPGAAAAIGA